MTAAEHKRFLAGDTAAAEAVVRRVGRITMPVAIAVLGDRDAAADVAQDVALDVLRGLHRLSNPESFDAWVRRIAARHSIRAARRRRLLRGIEFPLLHSGRKDLTCVVNQAVSYREFRPDAPASSE